jgi:hypothetical protein
MQNPAAKRHKYTDRISGEEQCGWSELSSRLAKISITQNKNLAVLAKNEAYAPRSLSSETAPATWLHVHPGNAPRRPNQMSLQPDDFEAMLLRANRAAT